MDNNLKEYETINRPLIPDFRRMELGFIRDYIQTIPPFIIDESLDLFALLKRLIHYCNELGKRNNELMAIMENLINFLNNEIEQNRLFITNYFKDLNANWEAFKDMYQTKYDEFTEDMQAQLTTYQNGLKNKYDSIVDEMNQATELKYQDLVKELNNQIAQLNDLITTNQNALTNAMNQARTDFTNFQTTIQNDQKSYNTSLQQMLTNAQSDFNTKYNLLNNRINQVISETNLSNFITDKLKTYDFTSVLENLYGSLITIYSMSTSSSLPSIQSPSPVYNYNPTTKVLTDLTTGQEMPIQNNTLYNYNGRLYVGMSKTTITNGRIIDDNRNNVTTNIQFYPLIDYLMVLRESNKGYFNPNYYAIGNNSSLYASGYMIDNNNLLANIGNGMYGTRIGTQIEGIGTSFNTDKSLNYMGRWVYNNVISRLYFNSATGTSQGNAIFMGIHTQDNNDYFKFFQLSQFGNNIYGNIGYLISNNSSPTKLKDFIFKSDDVYTLDLLLTIKIARSEDNNLIEFITDTMCFTYNIDTQEYNKIMDFTTPPTFMTADGYYTITDNSLIYYPEYNLSNPKTYSFNGEFMVSNITPDKINIMYNDGQIRHTYIDKKSFNLYDYMFPDVVANMKNIILDENNVLQYIEEEQGFKKYTKTTEQDLQEIAYEVNTNA